MASSQISVDETGDPEFRPLFLLFNRRSKMALDHVLGRPSANWKRFEVLLVVWLGYTDTEDWYLLDNLPFLR